VERSAGKLRLLRWAELPRVWSPETDNRVSVWEALHYVICALAYRRYTLCESEGWAKAKKPAPTTSW